MSVRAFALSALALVLAGCGGPSVAKVSPSPAKKPDAAPPPRPAAPVDAGAEAAAPPKAPSPFHLVARGFYGSSLEKLASGDLLVTHATKVWAPKPDGSIAVVTQLEGPVLALTEGFVNPIGPVVGSWPGPVWTSVIIGGPSPYANPMRIEKGKVRPDRRRSFFPVVHRWSEGRLLALRAQVEINNSDDVMWLADRFEVVKGAPAVPPKVPKNTLFRGAYAFEDGRVVAVVKKDGRKVTEEGAPTWLEWPAGKLDAVSGPLLGMNDMIVVNEVVGDRKGRVWVAGNEVLGFETRDGREVRKERPYLVRHEGGRFVSVFDAPNAPPAAGHVSSLSVADDGVLWLVLDDTIFAIDDKGWRSFTVPDNEEHEPLVARSVASRGAGDVWVLADRAKEDDPGHFRGYVLSTKKPPAVVDLDPEPEP